MHASPRLAEKEADFHRIFQKRTKIYNRLIECVAALLSRTDINLAPCNTVDRMEALHSERSMFPLTLEEKRLILLWHRNNDAYAVVDKMVEFFDQSKTEHFYPGEVVKWMTASLENDVQRNISTMIVQGISELNNPYCDAYLRAASSYCEVAKTLDALGIVFDTVVKAVASDERTLNGRDVIGFFQDVLRATNPHVPSTDIYWSLMSRSDEFANVLLLYADEDVRNGAYQLIRDLYIKFMEDTTVLDEAYNCARITIKSVVKRVAYESRHGMPRRHLEALLQTGNFLVSLLDDLDTSDDPRLVVFKEENDKGICQQWQIEVESLVRVLPEMSLPSPGDEIFGAASDYGSESDDVELLD